MIKLNRALSSAVVVGIFVSMVTVQGYGFRPSNTRAAGIKDIVGKWSGEAIQDGDSEKVPVALDLRLEENKIVGNIQSPAGEMKVTAATFANGQWSISCVSSEGVEARITCSIKNEKLVGQWSFGDNAGKFECARQKS